jgi:hypothetical protein
MGIQAVTSRRDIELPPMPGTSHDISPNDSLRERSTSMGANAVQGVKPILQMKQRDNAPTGDKFATGAHRNIGDRGNSNTIWHRLARLQKP